MPRRKKIEFISNIKKQIAMFPLQSASHFCPPVVAVLGHVDHGKTTLLDAIRKTDVAKREHGGITQKIGASSITFVSDKKERRITFIDTPGHEVFAKMRAQGANAADIGLLVVSSTDGVMHQTKESINLLQAAKIPFIVVLTKTDLPDKNIEKVKQQLLKEEVMLEGYGGDVSVIEVSAKTNTNIKELLDLILLVFELRQENQSVLEQADFKGIVIESKLDPKVGPKATIIIKNGSVSVRDEIESDGDVARVRTIINDKGERLQKATIGDAVEILGFEKVPDVGSIATKKSSIKKAFAPVTLPKIQPSKEGLSIILCVDTLGSLDAIANALPKKVLIVSQKTGEITPADVLLAKSVGAIIIGFNIKVGSSVLKLVSLEKVLLKNYNLIYELIDEINDVLKGKQIKIEEEIFGKAKVLASFPYEKTKVLGITVLEGRVARGDKATLTRKDEIIGKSIVSSVRIGKNPISKVEKGRDAGIILSPFLDFAIGDMLISYG